MPTGPDYWLPLVFLALMGLAFFLYAVLDGYDLGVGMLLPHNDEEQRDVMIASIGPFWDANETWLVLAVGLLFIAFPAAHSTILQNLYLPAALMLAGLILRGVAFDFRAKAPGNHKRGWDWAFNAGSIIAATTQGYMLGRYVLGFADTWQAYAFAVLSAVCVAAAYCFIGAAWLVMKTEGELQHRARRWARCCAWLMALGIVSVTAVNLSISDRIWERWFALPEVIVLLPIPILCGFLFVVVDRYLSHFPHHNEFGCWIPFAAAVTIFLLCFQALAYSFSPYVVPEVMTVWEAASASVSLQFVLYGAVIVVPTIIAYTVFSYRVFWGKTTDLRYY
ncbi:cytochrome d ubiquinol oxidase subunit II [Exilibacterium tricleocarpae]|uniref:Cytochrome d ubiquinol oxidase subunit II n=1 Tax=Exilibacterium tricleocarpae TaxID=2591008 RepID=A0A545SY76_9GAMM|nr:cytochrome d ubiquinol oxidase subunit II [Exilibacterium tricleocarpae]TQV69911.1 cytochrome d ubiquinol oxidase subunit II [Exilibacterium tricleocarpae]